MSRAATLHWFVQMAALLAVFGGVACYYSSKRQAAGTATYGVICGISLATLILGFFLSLKWSRHHENGAAGDNYDSE
jgi:hypothetical protein